MNIITKGELELIEQYKAQYIQSFDKYQEQAREENEGVQQYLDEHDGKKVEAPRTSYSEDRKKAKNAFNPKGPRVHESMRPSERRAKRQRELNARREESRGEFSPTDLKTWVAATYSLIHRDESKVTEMDPKDPTLNEDDFIVNHGSMLKKVALFAAAEELNSRRSIWSRIFNWKLNIQNYLARRKVRKSIQEDNGLTKKEFKKVLKFVENKDEHKFDSVAAFSEEGKKLDIDDLELEGNEDVREQVQEIKIDKVTTKDKVVKYAEKRQTKGVEKDEPELY